MPPVEAVPCALSVRSRDSEPSRYGGVRRISRLVAARQREQTEEFVELYDQRAGIEGVHAEARPPNGITPLALYWRAAYASATCRDRGCHQYVPIT